MRMRLLLAFTLTAMVAVPSNAATDTMIRRLLRFWGLTANPGQMKGPGDDFASGDIWLVSLGGTPAPLTAAGGYNSPVFSPVDGSLLALKGGAVVRIPGGGGTSVAVRKIPGALKLVGFDGENPDEVAVLMDSDVPSPLAILSLKSGKVTPIPYDRKAEDERGMLAQIRGQQRVYGDATLYIKTESKRGIAGTIEWTDVYLQRGSAAPQNVSACDGVNCGQPALSPDRRKVAFVKAGR
ncbi:MAG: hypothetical protein ACKV2U_27255 [Bryobacteraceae bacterium]